jgi:hypothetical protein
MSESFSIGDRVEVVRNPAYGWDGLLWWVGKKGVVQSPLCLPESDCIAPSHWIRFEDGSRNFFIPECLRRVSVVSDTLDSATPNKVTSWNDSPWWPEQLVRNAR